MLEYSVAMETLCKIKVTSTCEFVANKVCECILWNATTEIEAFDIITQIRGKLTKFSENFTPKYTTPTSHGSFESIIIN